VPVKALLLVVLVACGGTEKKPAPAPAPIANAAPAPAPAPPPRRRRLVPSECVAYGEIITRVVACAALPQESRDAVAASYAQMMSGLDNEMPPESYEAIADGCKAATDGMRQTLNAMECK
jgi:hypothetical protein